jgi:cbb3-type cytochrome oxidase subunit 3
MDIPLYWILFATLSAAAFVAVVISVFLPARKAHYEHCARIVFQDDIMNARTLYEDHRR